MKTLAAFLAEHLLERRDFDDEEWPVILREYTEDIEKGITLYVTQELFNLAKENKCKKCNSTKIAQNNELIKCSNCGAVYDCTE